MEGKGQPEDSELSKLGEEAEFNEEEEPQAAGRQRAAVVARSMDLGPIHGQVYPRGGPVQPCGVLTMLFHMSPEANNITLCDVTTHKLTLVMRLYRHFSIQYEFYAAVQYRQLLNAVATEMSRQFWYFAATTHPVNCETINS